MKKENLEDVHRNGHERKRIENTLEEIWTTECENISI